MFIFLKIFAFLALFFFSAGHVLAIGYEIGQVPAASVTLSPGSFWFSRLETNRLVTVRSNFKNCEKTRIENFKNAALKKRVSFQGIPFDDSDVYKVIEGAAYCIEMVRDKDLEAYVDKVVSYIARAQESDGYIYTARTLGVKGERYREMMGPTRFSSLELGHELYNAGHLYEAAVAYYKATGKRELLDVAVKSADYIDSVFGPGEGQLKGAPGHEEIELALCKLYLVTGEKRYLKLARFFLDQRGRNVSKFDKVFSTEGDLKQITAQTVRGEYSQNHKPVVEQREAVGHAVRAMYLYCAMADVAALTGGPGYLRAAEAIWENVVGRKLHLNGSVGARSKGESFGKDYELPNDSAYLETCAAIGNVFWNWRMFLSSGDGKYIDVLERALYNGAISGVSLSGDKFFYLNPMSSKGGYCREEWFGCSCCPVNVCRFIPQVPSFLYAVKGDEIYLNLYMASTAEIPLPRGKVKLVQKTDYPYDGIVEVKVDPEKDDMPFVLRVRIPGWCVGKPVPSDLYTQINPASLEDFEVLVNNKKVSIQSKDGYVVISRRWKRGDSLRIRMNMNVRQIRAHEKVTADFGRLAVERGPIVYCAERHDNDKFVRYTSIAPFAKFHVSQVEISGNKMPSLEVSAVTSFVDVGGLKTENKKLVLIPYFAWSHRSHHEMQTFFPDSPSRYTAKWLYRITLSDGNDLPSRYRICDGRLPASSADETGYCHSIGGRGEKSGYIEFYFNEEKRLAGVEVYWAVRGEFSLPKSWSVQYVGGDGKSWVEAPGFGMLEKDKYCVFQFPEEISSRKLRITVDLRPSQRAGILQCRFK